MKQKADKPQTHHHSAVNIAQVVDVNRQFKFRRANIDETFAGVALAESLMGSKIASVEEIQKTHNHTTITTWVTGNPVEGIHLMVPLTVAGELAVRNDQFNPSSPDLAHCAAPGEECAGIYVGVYAGNTKSARQNIMMGAATIRLQCFGSVPCFARAATDDGERSMRSLGFAPVDTKDGGLWVHEALITIDEQAA